MWQWQGNCWQFTFPVKHLCPKTNGKQVEKERKKIISLILALYYFAHFLEQLLRRVNFTDDCCLSVGIPSNNQRGNRRKTEGTREEGSEKKYICKVWEKMCLQGSCISQSDTQLPLSLSLTNNRAVRYKWPCDSIWITRDWEIWMAWRYRGGLHSIRVKGLSGWQSETWAMPETNLQEV